MNLTSARRYIEGLFVLLCWLLAAEKLVHADPGHDFLSSIISKLKEERPVENHHLFYDELLKATSRSSDEYQIQENQQESGLDLHPQHNEFDQNQNAIEQLNSWQNGADYVAGTDLNSPLVNYQSVFPVVDLNQGLPISNSFQQFNGDLQPYELNAYLNLPSQQLQPQALLESNFDSTSEINVPQLSPQDNRGPNLFHSAEVVTQAQHIAKPAYDFHTGNANGVQQLTLPSLLMNSGLGEALRNGAYNYLKPIHQIDDNLIDDTINAMRPYTGEYAIDGPHKQFMVEPLFVAMAGFVGIAMIFMSAVVFLPKLLTPPPEVSSLKGPQEIAALTKLAVQTIEGNDCTERIACEVGRAMRGLHVSEKPIEMLEVLVSKNVASQLARIRKAIANKQVCRLIQCKPLKSVGYSAAQKSKTSIEPKQPKTESLSHAKVDKAKQNAQHNKAKQSPEPRIELETKHFVVKKTLKPEQKYDVTTRKNTTPTKPL